MSTKNLQIPNAIYGREDELSILQEAFRWTSLGSTELVLLSGPPGIGKSALIHEMLKPTITEKCSFAWGKFNQVNNNQPYEPIIKCFRFMIRRILTESEAVLQQWKEKLRSAVGPNGSVITEVIPEAALILGDLPPKEQLPTAESRRRFERVFRQFVRAFTSLGHPLVLFFDDLQWADSTSLQLLHSILIDPENQHLLMIGAYRDQELNENGGVFAQWLTKEHEDFSIRQIQLEPLELAVIQHFVADSLQCRLGESFSLAQILYVKSIGNPLYFKQLLQTAIEDKLIYYHPEEDRWEWDVKQISQFPGIDGQIDYLIDRINKLPAISKQLLVLGACLGGHFSSYVLSAISKRTEDELSDHLSHAVQLGLLSATDDTYTGTQYHFTHDRIHQAAYLLLGDQERKDTHLAAGLFLLHHYGEAKKEQALFEISNHLNQALVSLSNEEREIAAKVNEHAGRKAMLSSDYVAAERYFSSAIDCLSDEYWSSHNEFTFQLHLKYSECLHLNANYRQAQMQLNTLMKHAKDWVQRAEIVKLRIDQYSNTGNYSEAIELGLEILREVGIRIPVRPNKLVVFKEMALTKRLIIKKLDELATLHPIDNLEARTMMELLVSLVAPSFFSNREVFAVITSKFIRLVFRHGSTPVAPVFYASFGMLMSTVFNDLSGGYQLGKMAVTLADQSGFVSVKAKVYVMFYSVIAPWMRTDRIDEIKLEKAAKLGLEGGDYVYASYAVGGLINLSYARDPMEEMHGVMRQNLQVVEQTKEELVSTNLHIYMEFAEKMQSAQKDEFAITGGYASEEEFLESLIRDESGAVTLYQFYTYKTQISYLFGNYWEAVRYAELANPYQLLSVHAPHLSIHHFYEALAIAAIRDECSPAERASYRRRLRQRYRQFKKWAKKSPENFNHQFLLIQAEMYGKRIKESMLMALFDQSITYARKHGAVQYLAVACERSARHHFRQGRERVALGYMQEAYDAYGEWGAKGKQICLRQEFPDWFPSVKSEDKPKQTVSQSMNRDEQQAVVPENSLTTIMKASQSLSQEMELKDIIQQLMVHIIQASGAEKGALIAQRNEGLWVEQVMKGDHKLTGRSCNLEESDEVPKSLIHYTSRLGMAVQMENPGQDDLFQNHTYFIQHQCRSVCSLPIFVQEQFAGVLYLENVPPPCPLQSTQIHLLSILATQALFLTKMSKSFEEAAVSGTMQSDQTKKTTADRLTDRELEVLNLMSLGMTNKEIAIQLGVKAGTIKVHVHNIFSKLDVNRRTKAIVKAMKQNLLR